MIPELRFLLRDTLTAFGGRGPLLVVLMITSGLLEGLAVTVALPLLGQMGGGVTVGGAVVGFLLTLPTMLNLPAGPTGVGILMVCLLLCSALAFLAQARLAAQLQSLYFARWQVRLFESIICADLEFIGERRSGDLIDAIVTEVTRVGNAFYHFCMVLAAVANLSIYAVLAILISPKISVIVLIIGSFLFIATRPLLKRAYLLGARIGEQSGEVQSFAGEFITAVKLVKANAAEPFVSARFGRAVHLLASLREENAFDLQKAKAVLEFGGAASVAVLLIAGPSFFAVDLATVLIVLALFVRLLPRVTALQQGVQALGTFLPALARVRELYLEGIARREPLSESELPVAIANDPVDITFAKVSVTRGGRSILKGIDLTIPAGRIVAFVGSSGSGKSTLVDVVLGLAPISSGRLLVGGVDLGRLPLSSWRRLIGYVGQDTALVSGTVSENVRFGNSASDEAVELALQRSAADFASVGERGAAIAVGDRGGRLSGGERQRLGLARALAVPRKLFVLDEATSALDNETEARVLETVTALAGEATVIIIAHRFSAIRKADVIHVVEDGTIVESGRWDDLDRPGTRFSALKAVLDDAQSVAGGGA